MRKTVFRAAELLLPNETLLPDWAVIACDQFTSQPEYWREVAEKTAGKPSAAHLIFPEAELSGDRETRIREINRCMRQVLDDAVLTAYPNAFVYVERTLKNGQIRPGIVGVVDLEEYDWQPDARTAIRATEKTVPERIPPRVSIRRDAALELSHVLMLCDDETDAMITAAASKTDRIPPIYDFDLMMGGGHIRAWLLQGADADALTAAIAEYEAKTSDKYSAMGVAPILYAVGDGNHSLATAKACWESVKKSLPDGAEHPARYAMVELENIRDASQRFEPIHRVVTGVNAETLIKAADAICVADGGYPVPWYAGDREGILHLDPALGELPIAILQSFLDRTVAPGQIDYIHGDDVARQLAHQENTVAFLLPAIPKDGLFPGIAKDGVLPRKTFSMGHAEEKRYYLEARRIKTEDEL